MSKMPKEPDFQSMTIVPSIIGQIIGRTSPYVGQLISQTGVSAVNDAAEEYQKQIQEAARKAQEAAQKQAQEAQQRAQQQAEEAARRQAEEQAKRAQQQAQEQAQQAAQQAQQQQQEAAKQAQEQARQQAQQAQEQAQQASQQSQQQAQDQEQQAAQQAQRQAVQQSQQAQRQAEQATQQMDKQPLAPPTAQAQQPALWNPAKNPTDDAPRGYHWAPSQDALHQQGAWKLVPDGDPANGLMPSTQKQPQNFTNTIKTPGQSSNGASGQPPKPLIDPSPTSFWPGNQQPTAATPMQPGQTAHQSMGQAMPQMGSDPMSNPLWTAMTSMGVGQNGVNPMQVASNFASGGDQYGVGRQLAREAWATETGRDWTRDPSILQQAPNDYIESWLGMWRANQAGAPLSNEARRELQSVGFSPRVGQPQPQPQMSLFGPQVPNANTVKPPMPGQPQQGAQAPQSLFGPQTPTANSVKPPMPQSAAPSPTQQAAPPQIPNGLRMLHFGDGSVKFITPDGAMLQRSPDGRLVPAGNDPSLYQQASPVGPSDRAVFLGAMPSAARPKPPTAMPDPPLPTPQPITPGFRGDPRQQQRPQPYSLQTSVQHNPDGSTTLLNPDGSTYLWDQQGRPIAQATAQQQSPPSSVFDIQDIANRYAGGTYVFGGGRDAQGGIPGVKESDCSAFVSAVWREHGLPLIAHTDGAYTQLKKLGAQTVPERDAQPGDVVFYMGAGSGGQISHHMGIYAGNGRVLDQSVSDNGGVQLRNVTHGGRFEILRDPRVVALDESADPRHTARPSATPTISRMSLQQGRPTMQADPEVGSRVRRAAYQEPDVPSSNSVQDPRIEQASNEGLWAPDQSNRWSLMQDWQQLPMDQRRQIFEDAMDQGLTAEGITGDEAERWKRAMRSAVTGEGLSRANVAENPDLNPYMISGEAGGRPGTAARANSAALGYFQLIHSKPDNSDFAFQGYMPAEYGNNFFDPTGQVRQFIRAVNASSNYRGNPDLIVRDKNATGHYNLIVQRRERY